MSKGEKFTVYIGGGVWRVVVLQIGSDRDAILSSPRRDGAAVTSTAETTFICTLPTPGSQEVVSTCIKADLA